MKGYEKVFTNGAVLREADAIPGAATNPLTLYWNAKTHHSSHSMDAAQSMQCPSSTSHACRCVESRKASLGSHAMRTAPGARANTELTEYRYIWRTKTLSV